jgi:DNA-binding transcriptional ArsR family regulator
MSKLARASFINISHYLYVMMNILAAVSDATRLKMLRLLARGDKCACVLPRHVGTSQPAVSQHLKVLRKAGLVAMRKDGKKRIYSVSAKGRKILGDIAGW